ncbi:hypothetical protein COU74_00400 [Candidatus Peregrinibacteria bacterium CG10_big_fil_rev_8_21_14_0_10_36_19]|nr:MAG: hypothetical protein COU74_00400 [Candidatus Peregrinibacteria bacterium CG10_big_fil_rev_8_21_14_0_10_36_19]
MTMKNNIFGLMICVIALTVLIYVKPVEVSHAELGLWDTIVANGDLFDWNDVFNSGSNGKNIYALVHEKALEKPERDAIKEVAKSYGLTVAEVNQVKNGTKTPIFSNPNFNGGNMTQEKAFQIMENVVEDYERLKDLYELQQELDLATRPSEMFSNGDLSDSGFDLVHDIEVMEEILFVKVVKNTLGQPYQVQLPTPYLPTEREQTINDYIANENPAATINNFASSTNSIAESKVAKKDVINGSIKAGNVKIKVGESSVDVNVLINDVCPSPLKVPLSKAIDVYVDKTIANEISSSSGNSQVDPAANANSDTKNANNKLTAQNLEPANPGNWLQNWCPILEGNVADPNIGFTGSGNFKSLGGTSTAILEQSAKAINKEPILKKHFSVCLEVEYIKQTVSSYLPSDTCILCEIEKINLVLDKTLSHSLVPNKVTGNLLESTKCKQAYEPLLDMKFVTIKAPVPTPPNDDLIFGRNIFDEWNKFVTRYQPLLLPKGETYIKSATSSSTKDTTQLDILNQLESSINAESAAALKDIEAIQASSDAMNTKLYAQVVLKELEGLATFFESYNKLFNDTAKVCKEIGKKPNIQ